MDLTSEQRQALGEFGRILADADRAPLSEPLQSVARLFRDGQAAELAQVETCVPPEVIATLEALGLVGRSGGMLTAGEFRLVSHLGLFLFCQTLAASAKLYYGNDSLALSRLLLPVEGRALDLCSGVGTQALVCARTATSVTAVEREPFAERIFWINAALNGLSHKVEFLIGDLLEPVRGRQFDRICCNPPFMPVPPGIRFPAYADGGPDGLAVVRRVLEGLQEVLAPNGRADIVGAVFGNSEGPDLSSLEDLAAEARLKLSFSCPTCEELDAAMLASCAATALGCEGGGDVKQVFRDHYARLGATHLYYFLLTASHASHPTVYFEHDDIHRAVIGLRSAGN